VATIAAKKATLKAAQVNLAYTNIVSPVDGMVITRYIDVGQTVVTSLQSSTLFLIGKDMTKMQVDTNVSEADVGEVAVGQKAYFTVQAYPKRTFWGDVRQVRRGPITVQNVVTYDVVVDVDNQDLALYPGMTADAHIITAEHTRVLRVPLPATRFVPEGVARRPRDDAGVRSDGTRDPTRGERGEHSERGDGAGAFAARHPGQGGRGTPARLWLLVNGSLQQVRVQTGLDDGTLIEVTGTGLKAGDEIVVNAIRTDAAPAALVSESAQQPRNGQSSRQQGGAGPRF
jgi:HlyD family secretion protein